MALLSFFVRTTTHGPMFNGAAARAIDDFRDEWEDEVAEEALGIVKDVMHASFKHPTGYYESHVRIRNSSSGPYVGDGGVIPYGLWLEGVGSRNATTRFKGYHMFRKAAAVAERRAHGIGEVLLHRSYLRRMN